MSSASIDSGCDDDMLAAASYLLSRPKIPHAASVFFPAVGRRLSSSSSDVPRGGANGPGGCSS
jgi:hypothetical protein